MTFESHTTAEPRLMRLETPSLPRGDWISLLVLTLLAAILRVWRLDHQSLWLDEVLTILNSETSLSVLWAAPVVDPNIPPAYYALIHFLLQLGREEMLLRLPSAIAGILSVPILYALVRRWTGHRAALISAGVLALSPFHVWYSQEARPYALLLLLMLASLWLFQHLLARPQHKVLAAGWLLCTAGAFYTHTVALPFIGALALYGFLEIPHRDRAHWFWLIVLLLLLLTPAFYRMALLEPDASANPHYRFQPAHIGYALWAFASGFSLGPNLVELRAQGLSAVIDDVALIIPVLILILGLLTTGAAHLWLVDRRLFWTLAALLILPIAFAVGGGILTTHPFNVRYAIAAFLGFVALVGIGIAELPRQYLRVGSAAGLGVISAASLGNYYGKPLYQREDTRAAVGFLNTHAIPGDLVLSSAAYMTVVIQHYGLRNDLTLLGYPQGSDPPPTEVNSEQAGFGARFVAPREVTTELDAIVGKRPRAWVFLSRTFHSDPGGLILKYFDSRMQRDAEFIAGGVRVLRYSSPLRKAQG